MPACSIDAALRGRKGAAQITRPLPLAPCRVVAGADGGNIDLDERSLKEAAAALRPPPALLALEDAGANSTGRSEEAGNFKVGVPPKGGGG